MRNLVLYILLITATCSCTKKDDFVFSESPDDRINETLAAYNKVLTDAPYGWTGVVYPSGYQTTPFGFYFRFDTANRVQMFSDFDNTSATTMRESSYRLKSLQQPSLLFDTYSYIHVLCDPDASKNNGSYGAGLLSDFEFAIDGIAGDTIKLTGRLHGSKAILVKATSQEAQDYYENKRNWEFRNFSRFLTYFKQLNLSGVKYDVYVDQSMRTIRLIWVTNEGIKTFTTNYSFTPDGIAFTTPFNDGKQEVTALENIRFDATQQVMTFRVNGANATISSVVRPMTIDAGAGKRWRDLALNNGAYWYSATGFHVDGVDDAYGIQNIPGFRAMLFFPDWDAGLDAGVIWTNGVFGPGLSTRFNTNGTVVFTNTATIGTPPAAGATAAASITKKFTESTGFYFVQTGPYAYDMVSVNDARSWISWLF